MAISDDHSIQKLTNQLNKIVEVCEVRVANQKHF
jgi:acetolactate synthase regulatory subunit